MLVFLGLNGQRLEAPDDKATDLVLAWPRTNSKAGRGVFRAAPPPTQAALKVERGGRALYSRAAGRYQSGRSISVAVSGVLLSIPSSAACPLPPRRPGGPP